MEQHLKLVGFYAEGSGRADDPVRIVLVDSNNDEHEARTPEQLWRAIWSIYADDALPPAVIDVSSAQVQLPSGDNEDPGVYETIAEAASSFVENRYGQAAGKLAEHLIRNGAKPAHRFLRKVSR